MPIEILVIIIVSITGGLGFATFATWLQHKEKQAKLGGSANELGEVIATQQAALEAAERRIQNLEAIVTSQSWDALPAAGLAKGVEQNALPTGRIELDDSEEAESDAKRAARLARRV